MLTGPRTISTSVDRVGGYERALVEAGIPFDAALVRYGGFGLAGGYRMANDVLAADPRPTALFAANNFIAFGALRALRELRLRVPDDISLCASTICPRNG